jgi:hypothetical protein
MSLGTRTRLKEPKIRKVHCKSPMNPVEPSNPFSLIFLFFTVYKNDQSTDEN